MEFCGASDKRFSFDRAQHLLHMSSAKAVNNSLLSSMYLLELWLLADNVREQCERIFQITQIGPGETFLRVSKEVHGLIASILSNAANIKKLLDTRASQRKHESKIAYAMRQRRSKALSDILNGIELEFLLESKVRNTLEHFDEYLDEADELVTIKGHPTATLAVSNMVLSHWDSMAGESIYPIRVYIVSERKFYNMKWSIDLGKIHAESLLIVERFKSNPETEMLTETGAICVRLK